MATGNKCIILCPEINEKMFPFTETLSCLLPVGDTTFIERLLHAVAPYHFDETIVIGPSNAGLDFIKQKYQVCLKTSQADIKTMLLEELQTSAHALIFYGNTWMDHRDIDAIYQVYKQNKCGALVKEYGKYEKSIDSFGVSADHEIHAIYAHPREHYVNAKLCKAYVWNDEMKDILDKSNNGFHNVNCGQMPNSSFYLEEVMQNAIEEGIQYQAILSTNPFIEIIFPWNISEANDQACLELQNMDANKLQHDTKLDTSCKCMGFLETGKNVSIADDVIFEGNCKIGNNVIIEKGAIIGRNCIINDGSVIQYQCRISDHTVIGTNNKIGYHAEISGVTFDGVCAVHGCEVYGVIGKKVDIAAGVRMAILRFDDEFVTQRVQGNAYVNPYTNRIFIGDYCRTGVNNVYLPGVKVGSRCAIGPGVLVEKDIAPNHLILLKQETIVKDWGSHRYGW